MKTPAHIFVACIFALSITSCEKAFFDDEVRSTKPTENFEYLWKECNEKYAFFKYKGIDWNERYNYYKPRITDNMSEEALFAELGAMLNELRDGHVNLVSPFNVSIYHFNFNSIDNINERVVDEFYLTTNMTSTGPFLHNALDNGNVGYIRFKEFSGQVTHDQLDFILNRYANTKGLILDVRENGGGAVSDMWSILAHFVTSKTLVYQTYTKSGPGHDDFSGPEMAYAEPEGVKYTKKIVLLTDRGTFSSGSHITLAMRNLPQVVVMGDTTGGGLGLPNGGQLPNGWTYRFSVTSTRDLDGANYENGVPPDVYKLINLSDTNKDDVIDAAIAEINK